MEQIYWEDVEEGMDLPTLVKEPTTQQLVKYAGASGDYYQIPLRQGLCPEHRLGRRNHPRGAQERVPGPDGDPVDGPAGQFEAAGLPIPRHGLSRPDGDDKGRSDTQIPAGRGKPGGLRRVDGKSGGAADNPWVCHSVPAVPRGCRQSLAAVRRGLTEYSPGKTGNRHVDAGRSKRTNWFAVEPPSRQKPS